MKKDFKKFLIPLFLAITLVAGYFVVFDKDRALIARADYLRLTETADYYHVQSDTYGIRLWKSSIDNYYQIYDGNGVSVSAPFGGSSWVRDSGGTDYYLNYDENRSVALIDNSKNRITIKISGKFDNSYGASDDYLTDGSSEVTVDQYFYIYPQYFNLEIQTDFQDGVNLGSNFYSLFVFDQHEGFFDSGKLYAGTTTGETLVSNYSSSNTDYSAILATSTPDFQITKLIEPLNVTSTFYFYQYTEDIWQGVTLRLRNGELKGKIRGVFNIRPKINTTPESRRAWAQQMLAMDAAEFTVGTESGGWEDQVYGGNRGDGTLNVVADNNQAEFTVHANATNTWATLSATSTGGASTLAIKNNQGLEDPNGNPVSYGASPNSTSSWAYVGNRRPYGSFDVTDPDVLFYWDMNSTTTGQAPNKGIGPVEIIGDFGNNDGVAGKSIGPPTTWDSVIINKDNFNSVRGSISFWYKNASTTDTIMHHPIYHGDSWSDSEAFRVTYNPSSTFLSFVVAGDTILSSSVDMQNSNWHHLRINYDADIDQTELFVDGKLITTSNTAFSPLDLYENVRLYDTNGNIRNYQLDEFYISKDPDQPDAPSYFDAIKYYDISGGTITGIPETGLGSMKWNHPIDSPIWQTQREDPVFAVHDWSPKTRSTSTGEYVDHLVLDLPLDGVGKGANAGKVWDKVSEGWIGTVSEGAEFEQGYRGNGANINAEVEKITVPSSSMNPLKGTIEFDYKLTDTQASYARFFVHDSHDNTFRLSKEIAGFSFMIGWSDAYFTTTKDVFDGYWHHFRITYDTVEDRANFYVDGALEAYATTTLSAPNISSGNLIIGNHEIENRYIGGTIDNFRIYNDVILPYGAYYTGEPNDGHYGGAHPDLIDYWDGASADTQIATKTITASNCSLGAATSTDGTVNSATEISNSNGYAEFDASIGTEGSLSFWFKPEYAFGDSINHILVGQYVDATDRLEVVKRNGNSLYFYIGSIYIETSAVDWATSTWHHVRASWKRVDGSNDYMELFLDGESVAVSNSKSIPADFDLNAFRIGNTGNYSSADAVFDNVYLTDSSDTPEISTAFGKPLVAPQVFDRTNGADWTYRSVETDYDVAMLNDIATWLATWHGTLQDDTTFLITESLNPPQASDPVVPLNRIHPLISTTYTSGYSTITVQRGDGSYADDFKLIFSETDTGVSSCYIGQGTAGSWGSNLCSATTLLSEIDQNSVIQTDQTGILSLVQNAGTEAIIRNYFVLSGEATTTEDWHIFADGSVVVDRTYGKISANTESRTINSSFPNHAYYPAEPATDRTDGTYRDSLFVHLTSANTDLQNDYLNSVTGATSSVSGLHADMYADLDADSYAESYGAYVLDASYAADPSVPVCPGTCGQPIYHTIGTSTAEVNVTVSAVDQISSGLFIVKLSGTPDLSGIHKRDKFTDSGADDWNIISIDETNDQIIVGDQEQNGGTPATGAGTVGPWYNSLFDWEAAEDRDLTSTSRYANGEIEMVECWPMTDYYSGQITFNDWTTDVNNFIKVYTPINVRHKGVWSDDYYNLQITSNIYIAESYVFLEGLQLSVGSNGINTTGHSEDFRIANSIVKGNGTANYCVRIDGASSVVAYAVNNIIYSCERGIARYYDGAGRVLYAYNNTIYDTTTSGLASRQAGYMVAINNLVASSTDSYEGTFRVGTDYNSTDSADAIGQGNNNRVSQTFSFVDVDNNDFHLTLSDTGARGYGTPIPHIPISFYSDIDGQTRGGGPASAGFDIGADQTITNHANKFKIELSGADQTVYQPRFLIHDFYPQSGKRGSEEEYVVYHNDMSSVVNYSTDKISGLTNKINGTPSTTMAYRGLGIKFDGSTKVYPFPGQ